MRVSYILALQVLQGKRAIDNRESDLNLNQLKLVGLFFYYWNFAVIGICNKIQNCVFRSHYLDINLMFTNQKRSFSLLLPSENWILRVIHDSLKIVTSLQTFKDVILSHYHFMNCIKICLWRKWITIIKRGFIRNSL